VAAVRNHNEDATSEITKMGMDFYPDEKLVGQAPVQLVDQGRKSVDTEVHVNKADGNTVLAEIEVMGWTKSLQFGQAAGGSGSSQSGQ